jgi:KDO2-lipid IV(A) lauroyltransferase
VFSKNFEQQCFRTQISTQLETIRVAMTGKEIRLDGFDDLKKTLAEIGWQKNGLVIVSAHIGSWEFVARYVAKALKDPFYILAKPSKISGLREFLQIMRKKSDVEILWTDSKTLMHDMIHAMKNRGALGFVMDQRPNTGLGTDLDFLGHHTTFVNGPASLAISRGAAVVSVFCLRIGPWHYKIDHEVLFEPDHGETDVGEMTKVMAIEMENIVNEYPEQWAWHYKRWRFER